MNKNILPLVSVIITTKNEEKNIDNCLRSINNQTYPKEKIEIIVVDNSSADKTKEIAQNYTKNVFNKGPERSAQRNYGVEKSNGKYIIYLDADMVLSTKVIEKSVERLENSEVIALYVPEIILGNSYWSRVRRFERSFYDGTVVDCARFIKKEAFEKVGGFDESMTGPEDWDLDKKIRKIGRVEVLEKYNFGEINGKLAEIDLWKEDFIERLNQLSSRGFIYHNETKFNIKKYFQKKSYYVKSFNVYIKKWGKDDSDIKRQFGFIYRYFGVFMENGKWKRFFRYPELTLGVFLLRFLVGISFVATHFK